MNKKEQYLNSTSPIEEELNTFFSIDDDLTIFDVGSCEGLDAIRYAQWFPNSSVHAFEPISTNFETIKDNIEEASCLNVFPQNIALSNESGEAEFHVSSDDRKTNENWDAGNKSSSLLKPKDHVAIYPWCKFDDVQKVKTLTLLDYCKNNNLRSIDFMHLDVQGAEQMVLNGAGLMINEIKMIWSEVGYFELYDGQLLQKEMVKYMEQLGFVSLKEDYRKISGDQLFIKKDFLIEIKGQDFYNNLKRKQFLNKFSPRMIKRLAFTKLSALKNRATK